MELETIINNIHALPKESFAMLAAEGEEVTIDKNIEFIRSGHVEPYIYLIKSGIVRGYVCSDAKEITFWIGREGEVALSLESYINLKPGYESIVTIEPSVLFRISSASLHALYEKDVHLSNWGRKFAEREILRAEKCLIPQLFTTGKFRYLELLKTDPELLNRIPLEYLASYLGLTPVSLSRIRASI